MKKNVFRFCAYIALLLALASCSQKPDGLFQYSTIDMLMKAHYEGSYSVSYLRDRGNFGIGTYNALDGEMIVLDGVFYKSLSDGVVALPADADNVPYASLCEFRPSAFFEIEGVNEIASLEAVLQQQVIDKNIVYAVKVTGLFDSLSLRTVVKQDKPYKALVDVVKTQNVYERSSIHGTLVGYLSPSMLGKILVSGLHLHFISTDLKTAGHVIDVSIGSLAKCELMEIQTLGVHLINSPAQSVVTDTVSQIDIESVER